MLARVSINTSQHSDAAFTFEDPEDLLAKRSTEKGRTLAGIGSVAYSETGKTTVLVSIAFAFFGALATWFIFLLMQGG